MACAASVFLLTQHFFCYTCILTYVMVHRQVHVKRVLGKLSVFQLRTLHYLSIAPRLRGTRAPLLYLALLLLPRLLCPERIGMHLPKRPHEFQNSSMLKSRGDFLTSFSCHSSASCSSWFASQRW